MYGDTQLENNMIPLIVASRNPSKTSQIIPLLSDLPIPVVSLDKTPIKGEAEEDGLTLDENASKKALYVHERSKGWTVADDTGFFIDALNGLPGIKAARWAGEGMSTEDIMHFTLDALKDVPVGKRTACFRTVAVLVSPSGVRTSFVGEVRGTILTAPRMACQPMMPYSAIFVPDGQPKVWAQMSIAETNEISHRAKAFRQVHDFLKRQL